MDFIQKIVDGWGYFVESIRILIRYPFLIVPLFVSWIIFASTLVYLSFYHPYFSFDEFGILYLILLFLSLVICLGNVFMLELLQQIGNKRKISFFKALLDTLTRNLFAVFIVSVVWSVIWFGIVIVRGFLSIGGRVGRGERSARGAARTLGGADSSTSAAKAALAAFEKTVRMAIFMVLPAIAWENRGPISAFKRAGKAAVMYPLELATEYTLTGIVSILMAVPLVILFAMDSAGFHFSELFWVGVIAYEGIIWASSIYLEQVGVSLIYLEFLNFERTGDLSIVNKRNLLENAFEITSDI